MQSKNDTSVCFESNEDSLGLGWQTNVSFGRLKHQNDSQFPAFFTSSANTIASHHRLLRQVFIHSKKRTGPTTKPCGSPIVISINLEYLSPSFWLGSSVSSCPTTDFFTRPLNLAAMFFCAPAQKHKIGNTDSHSGFFCQMNLRKEKKLSTLINWAAMNVTSAETWMNFNQVLQTEDTMKIIVICLIVNVCFCKSFCSVLPPKNWSV